MRIAIVVGSRHGSTTEIGSAIGAVLTAAGHDVTELDPDDVTSLAGFDAAVVGSAIYIGRWMPAIVSFFERLGAQLAAMPTWVFWSGPVGGGGGPTEGESPAGANDVLERIRPRGQAVFEGRLDRADLGLRERAVVAVVGAPDGDFRDFDQIEEWAGGIVETLSRP